MTFCKIIVLVAKAWCSAGRQIRHIAREGANKRGNSSRLTQSFHFFMFEPI
ncbi:response regulator, partial [Escherichia coli]